MAFESPDKRESDADGTPSVLKTCPLCGVLNTESSTECVSCGWSGEFDRDPETVRQRLEVLYCHIPTPEYGAGAEGSTTLDWFRKVIGF